MSLFTVGPYKSYIATEDLPAYVLVKKTNATDVELIDTEATDVAVGVTVAPALAGQAVTVRLLNAGGTVLIKANAAIAAGAAVRQLNTGVVDDSGTTPITGYAENAATAAGDVIEVLLA